MSFEDPTKNNKPEGTNHWYRVTDKNGVVHSFETKEEKDEFLEQLQEEKN